MGGGAGLGRDPADDEGIFLLCWATILSTIDVVIDGANCIDGAKAEVAAGVLGEEEEKFHGGMQWANIGDYLRSCGVASGCLTVALFGVDTAMEVTASHWLVWWAALRWPRPAGWYLKGFAGIAMVQVGVKVVRQLIGATSMLHAARAFHEALVGSVLGSALSFFHVTPHGRILNRFSGDMSIIDSNFHKEIYEVVEMGLNLVRRRPRQYPGIIRA